MGSNDELTSIFRLGESDEFCVCFFFVEPKLSNFKDVDTKKQFSITLIASSAVQQCVRGS